MTGPRFAGLLVVRPEPGNTRTVARLRESGVGAGVDVAACPLFVPAPVAWDAPDPAAHDALLVTSANAIRLGGPNLAALMHLPVIAVGAQSAGVARTAGFDVRIIGDGGVHDALAAATDVGFARLLHLAGREHIDSGHATVIVYASEDRTIDPTTFAQTAAGRIVLLHSVRAAARVAALVTGRASIGIAALSPAVRAAAGEGWACALTAPAPTDAALCTVALAGCTPAIDRAAGGGDKAP